VHPRCQVDGGRKWPSDRPVGGGAAGGETS